jgi:putative transposase
MARGYNKSNTSVYQMLYHYVWIPKRRKPVLIGDVKKRLIALIKEKLSELKCKIVELQVMSDHVHLFVESNPRLSPNYILQQVKGYTSHELREEFPHLRKLPSLWTDSYFVSSAGDVSKFIIEKYIQEQTNAKNKHCRAKAK